MRESDARAAVMALIGAAVSGSIGTALLILHRVITEHARVDTIGILLLTALILGACWMSRIFYDIGRPRRRRRDRSGQSSDDRTETIPPSVERNIRRGFKRHSASDLERIAASGDLEDWYLRIVQAELRRRNGRVKKLVFAGSAIVVFWRSAYRKAGFPLAFRPIPDRTKA
jgi:hypothetical protein